MIHLFQKFSLFCICMCAFTMNMDAQNKSEDVVYLKNGSVIHGVILEIIPDQSVKIRTADQNVFIFKMEEVEKISKETPAYDYKKIKTYVNNLDVGFLLGIGNASIDHSEIKHGNDYNGISIRDVNSFHVSANTSLGFGIGYEKYNGSIDFLPTSEYMPLFFDIRSYNLKEKVSAGAIVNIGYDVGLTKKTDTWFHAPYTYGLLEFKGGFFYSLAPSMRILNKHIAYLFSIGYEFHNHAINTTDVSSSFLNFRAGIEF